jgi:hypothetical protein
MRSSATWTSSISGDDRVALRAAKKAAGWNG